MTYCNLKIGYNAMILHLEVRTNASASTVPLFVPMNVRIYFHNYAGPILLPEASSDKNRTRIATLELNGNKALARFGLSGLV